MKNTLARARTPLLRGASLGFLGGLCLWGTVTSSVGAQTWGVPIAGTRISPSDIESALIAKNWKPTQARTYANDVTVYLADLAYISAAAVTVEKCPALHSTVYIDYKIISRSQWPEYIEHEMHHIQDYASGAGGCAYNVKQITQDYFSLSPLEFRSVEVYSKLPRDDWRTQQHYNHDLIASLNFDISKLPNWYATKYFSYMNTPAPVSVYVPPSRTTPTASPSPTSTPRVIVVTTPITQPVLTPQSSNRIKLFIPGVSKRAT